MPRHARDVDQRLRAVRLSTLAAVWVCGLAAGLAALLAAAAKFGCPSGSSGLACRSSGSVLGVVLLVTVITVVMVVTLLTGRNRPARAVLVTGGFGVAALAVCLVAACSLLGTA